MRQQILIELVEQIQNAKSLDEATAYANAILILNKSQRSRFVSVKLEAGTSGNNYPFINVIKEVRSIFGLGLKESKDLVEAGHVWTKMNRVNADALVKRLKLVGATANVVEG